MILILGGTTEGRLAVNTLDESGSPFYYSTRGDEQEVSLHHGIRLQGGMDAEAMELFCRQKGIRLLVDAAHPFAEELHRNVATVGQRLQIPVIRLERIYPPRTACPVIWCAGYDEAVKKIQQSHPASLLLLTGVQSIARLAALWKDENICCHCRILDRDSSRLLADRQGFPRERLCYYHEGEDERIVMEQLHPEAIILKESGLSGGFKEKVEVATSLGIQVFAIQRPLLPPSFITVTGRHGLRRQVEQLLPEFYPQHTGLTTGTCATAPDTFPVLLPDGEILTIPARPTERILSADGKTVIASAFTVKDAGDDPDITNGMTIETRVTLHLSSVATSLSIHIDGGCGVGRVTLPGLGIEVGQAAINATPRRMIENSIRHLLHSLPMKANPVSIDVLISVPGGEEIARRTFNPRLGIEGGISIIGTSGIVKPFSTDAFIRSIAKSMEVARATGSPRVVINSGAKSERFVRAYYPELPPQAFVHYGNFIGETLKIAAEEQVPHVTLGVMMGKAVKLAEGNLDTHSKKVTMNKEFIQDLARQTGCSEETLAAIGQMNLARELWDIIPEELLEKFGKALIELCHRHCDPLLPNGELTVLLITENGKIYS